MDTYTSVLEKAKSIYYCIVCADLCVRLRMGGCETGIPDTYVIVHALYIDSLPEQFDADPETSV